MAKGDGMMMLFGGGPPPSDDVDDEADDGLDDAGAFDDDAPEADEPSVEFTMYAEQALGSRDPGKVKALRDAIRAELGGGEMGPPLPDEGFDDEGIV